MMCGAPGDDVRLPKANACLPLCSPSMCVSLCAHCIYNNSPLLTFTSKDTDRRDPQHGSLAHVACSLVHADVHHLAAPTAAAPLTSVISTTTLLNCHHLPLFVAPDLLLPVTELQIRLEDLPRLHMHAAPTLQCSYLLYPCSSPLR